MNKSFSVFFDRIYESALNEEMLKYDFVFPNDDVLAYLDWIITTPLDDYFEFIYKKNEYKEVSKCDFAQFSDPNDVTINLCKALSHNNPNNDGLNAYEIGKMLLPLGKKHEAYRKYGEGSAKGATELGLLSCFSNTYFMSCIGKVFLDLSPEKQKLLLARLVLRMNEFSQLFLRIHINGSVNLREYMECLTDHTYVRRRSTFRNLLRMICADESFDSENLGKLLYIP